MRFDNPIFDHGFIFPDIADFPELKKEPRHHDIEDEHGVYMMREAIKKSDLDMFKNGYRYYMKNIDTKLSDKLDKMFKFYSRFQSSRQETTLPTNRVYEDLYENGVSCLKVDVSELKERLEQQVNALSQRPDSRPPVGTLDRVEELGPNYINLLNNMFSKLGILQGATKYNKGRPLVVSRAVLHISTPTDQHWKHFLYDCDMLSKTTNLHIDPKEDTIKAIMYINDVTQEDGPFSYVLKSNRWVYDDLQNIFSRSISTSNYCSSPEHRAVVFQLPKVCRVTGFFGRLLLDDSTQQNMILEKERMLTSDLGNLCIFDPAGMHRGGVCKQGTRVALQILMKPTHKRKNLISRLLGR